MSLSRLALPLTAALALAGCASGNSGIDVKRFHLGAPITRGTIAVVPADAAQAASLEYRSYADAVAAELRAVGFSPVDNAAGPAYLASLAVTQNVQVGPSRPSGFSIGLGGGSFGRGGGAGGGIGFPVGKSRRDAVEIDSLALQIKRRSDSALIWEGSALTTIDTRSSRASLANAVPAMARALLTGFPGPSGRTERYPLK